jgi:hypothetical protein
MFCISCNEEFACRKIILLTSEINIHIHSKSMSTQQQEFYSVFMSLFFTKEAVSALRSHHNHHGVESA